MKHILFPTDFSENSLHALDFAVKLANKAGAKLFFFNSYVLPPSRVGLMRSYTDTLKKDSVEGLEQLKSKVLSEKENEGLDIVVESRIGDFVPLIPKVVEEFNIDLIVMGAKGATGIINSLIGSNTIEVIQNTNCPVLAVPEEAIYGEISKIAYATDLQKIVDEECIKPLFELGRLFGASIEFVNIIWNEEKDVAEERAKQANYLEEFAGEIPSSMYLATDNNIIKGLGEYVIHHKPGMFAMLSRKHSLFERIFKTSTTKKLTFQTKIPLLVMSE